MTKAAIAELIEAMRAEHAAAIESLTVMLADLRADCAVFAARLDKVDPKTPLPGFCSVKQAAGACGYTDEAIRQWARAGQVTGEKIGGVWKVELASVLDRAGRHR